MIDPLANISGMVGGLVGAVFELIAAFLQPFSVLVVTPLLQIASLFTTAT